jgi:hypothetical protein
MSAKNEANQESAEAEAAGGAVVKSDIYADMTAAMIERPDLVEDIPNGAFIALLPEDDPDSHPAAIEHALLALGRGHNVYLRHVSSEERQRWAALLPERHQPRSPLGTRRQRFNPDGSIASDEVLGPDGEWHPFESEEPTDAGGS